MSSNDIETIRQKIRNSLGKEDRLLAFAEENHSFSVPAAGAEEDILVVACNEAFRVRQKSSEFPPFSYLKNYAWPIVSQERLIDRAFLYGLVEPFLLFDLTNVSDEVKLSCILRYTEGYNIEEKARLMLHGQKCDLSSVYSQMVNIGVVTGFRDFDKINTDAFRSGCQNLYQKRWLGIKLLTAEMPSSFLENFITVSSQENRCDILEAAFSDLSPLQKINAAKSVIPDQNHPFLLAAKSKTDIENHIQAGPKSLFRKKI